MDILEERVAEFVKDVRAMDVKDLSLEEAQAETDPLMRLTMVSTCNAINIYNATWRKMRDLALEKFENL